MNLDTMKKQLEKLGVEIAHEERNDGSTTAYFYNDHLIALKRDKVMSIFRTYEEKVSDIYNVMLQDTLFEHYISNGRNFITVDELGRDPMENEFTWRVE